MFAETKQPHLTVTNLASPDRGAGFQIFPFNRMDYNRQHRGTNSKTHSRSGFQYADWLIQVLIAMVIILVKWTAILYI